MTTKTDKYANLRATLEMNKNLKMSQAFHPDMIRALLAERDALCEALEVMVEMVEMNGFGRAYAMNVARAALAQEQGEKYDN